jgi:hypothetical protein
MGKRARQANLAYKIICEAAEAVFYSTEVTAA